VSTQTIPAYGPSALGGSLKRFAELTLTLARTEFKLRYFGSALGYLWSLMRPLLFFGVIYVFFTQIINLSKGIPHYGVYLLTGIVLWTYFGEVTGNCVQCLVGREGLLRKVRFPRMVIPLSVSLTSVFNLGMNSIAVIVFALANGITPAWSWLEMFPIMLGFIILATGIGMLLSALYVRYRDVQPIWEVLVQTLFYASPIMYVASSYKGFEHYVLTLNPFAMLLTQMGYAFIHPGLVYYNKLGGICGHHLTGCVAKYPMRSAAGASGGAIHVLIAIAIIPAVFALGWWVFIREAPRVAENL
jgi:ABC-2 type transport system permease protein